MVDVEIVPLHGKHIAPFLDVIRPEDRDEAVAAYGVGILLALLKVVNDGENYAVLVDGQPEVLFGVIPVEESEDVGVVWLMGSHIIEKRPVRFSRVVGRELDKLKGKYRVLTNCADLRNGVHLTWLLRLGFRFVRIVPEYGAAGLPFMHFIWERKD